MKYQLFPYILFIFLPFNFVPWLGIIAFNFKICADINQSFIDFKVALNNLRIIISNV